MPTFQDLAADTAEAQQALRGPAHATRTSAPTRRHRAPQAAESLVRQPAGPTIWCRRTTLVPA